MLKNIGSGNQSSIDERKNQKGVPPENEIAIRN